MTYRVIQCSIGNVGTLALPLVLDHPDLELVAAFGHSAEKRGRDAATLVGRDPVGVPVTDDFDAIVATPADCVLYYSAVVGRERDACDDMRRLLESGKNVVVPWLSALQYPRAGARFDPDLVRTLDAAGRKGGASLLMTGTDPGFCSDVLPAVLSGIAGIVTGVRVQEILDYSSFHDPRLTAPDFFCFGQPLDHDRPNFVSPTFVMQGWGATPAFVAAALGFDAGPVEFFERRAPATVRVDAGPAGIIEPGTIGGRWFGLRATTPSHPDITFEHVTYVDANLPADWPVAAPVRPGYRIVIEGVPDLELHLAVDVGGDHFWGAMAVTATRTTNMVAAVCAAEPGVVDPFRVPLGDLTFRRPPATV